MRIAARRWKTAPVFHSPGQPFLPAFAKALIEGRLIEGFPGHPSDPLALASATIYVPTRRAARALRTILVDLNPVKSAILPRISPLGDVDEDAAFFNAGAAGVLISIRRLALPNGSCCWHG